MVDLVTIRRGPSLVPATAFDLEELERARQGEPLRTRVTFSRSAAHNRWYRALVAKVADAVGMSRGLLHSELKFKAGLVLNIIMSKTAGPFVELWSTKFTEMGEIEFTQYTDAAIEFIFSDYLPDVRRQDVFDEIDRMVGPRPR